MTIKMLFSHVCASAIGSMTNERTLNNNCLTICINIIIFNAVRVCETKTNNVFTPRLCVSLDELLIDWDERILTYSHRLDRNEIFL